MIGRIADKFFLSVIALVLMINIYENDSTIMVLSVLLMVMAITLTDIFSNNLIDFCLSGIVSLLALLVPGFVLAVIPCCYGLFSTPSMENIEAHIAEIIREKTKADGVTNKVSAKVKGLSTTEIINLIITAGLTVAMLIISEIMAGPVPVCISLIASIMAVKSSLSQSQKKQYFDKYDRARTDQLAAEETRNRIEKQSEDNAYMAMLQERNRIAREIHDNVGHMLTRAIVQMQAIKIINKDENIRPHLESVDETINTAMLNIRRSVHELHDESIDLSIMLNEIVKTLPESFKVDCRTSIESAADTELKNAILGIVREAVTNIAKYSKGDKVRVEVIEHAAFWRIYINDNGTNIRKDYGRQLHQRENGSGMGLLDIGKRAERMRGTVNISSDEKGFTVLVIIPKGER